MNAFDCEAVLFDLDGTLVDTAPDLLLAVNVLRWRRGLAAMALAELRVQVSHGSRAMLAAAIPQFELRPPETQAALVQELLAAYGADICRDSRPFDGVVAVLDALAARRMLLGIVTNKPVELARQLVRGLGLESRFQVLLGGDSVAERKPHPMPVLTACTRLGVGPARAVLVGDDARDIESGRRAGCATVAVSWGYSAADKVTAWGAHAIIDTPAQLLDLVRS
jgi:2-phosphoglycolate phosphatase